MSAPPPPGVLVRVSSFFVSLTTPKTERLAMMADRAGAARRRRERRLRSMLRHDRQTVAMELAAALHHSRDARPNVAYVAPRGQKTARSSGSLKFDFGCFDGLVDSAFAFAQYSASVCTRCSH